MSELRRTIGSPFAGVPPSDDHYVCTHLPNGARVQVGPMALMHARTLSERIKAAGPAPVAYNTWVDWRLHFHWPVLTIDAFYSEVMGACGPLRGRQPTLPLGHLSDHILIEELKRRGYVVPKKSHVCDLTCQEVYPVHEYEAMARNSVWLDSAHHSLAQRLGWLLLHNRAVELEASAGGFGETVLRMRAVVVAPESLRG